MTDIDSVATAPKTTPDSFGTSSEASNEIQTHSNPGELVGKMQPPDVCSPDLIPNGKSGNTLSQANDSIDASEPRNQVQREVLEKHSPISFNTSNLTYLSNQGNVFFNESEAQNGVRNRYHSHKPVNGTPGGMENISNKGMSCSTSFPVNRTESLETQSPISPGGDEMGRGVSKRAVELCNQFREEITRSIDEQMKGLVDRAVDRILLHSEAVNLIGASNWLSAK